MKVVLFLTVLLSGLVAGLFYAYSCSVNPGLRALADDAYIKAMQSINDAIQNPFFFLSFMGLMLVYPVAAWMQYRQGVDASFYLQLGAVLVYYIGVFGVTAACNVPLNEELARFPVQAVSQGDISAMRKAFEQPWNQYHAIRTFCAIVAFGLSVCSLIKQKP